MKTAGIVAEFDPLHNGHRYLFEQARAKGAEAVAVVMSGSAVQRGRLAVWDKYSRARAAVRAGADIVFELPAPLSCSNAEVFSRSGVALLAALGDGAVDMLVFGSETEDLSLVLTASRAVTELKDSAAIRERLALGMSYPAALSAAVGELCGPEAMAAVSGPNSILAAEYCRALEELAPWCEPALVHRTEQEGIRSATSLREMLSKGEDISPFVPEVLPDPCLPEALDKVLLYSVYSADKDTLLTLPDCDEALADRFLKAARSRPRTAEELLSLVKSKNYTHARLRRTLLHLALGVRREDIKPPAYLRPLAFNEIGAKLLAESRPALPLSTSLSKLCKDDPTAARFAQLEDRASVLRALGTKSGTVPNDFTESIKLQ
ncbi:MAG: nucleotidyltransferase family protein [Ruminococcus sp.]|nr:nucleotidyltransferase family protein [Ruminococcus sp.]